MGMKQTNWEHTINSIYIHIHEIWYVTSTVLTFVVNLTYGSGNHNIQRFRKKSIVTHFLSIERLKTFSDSVLLVALTILAYNLIPPSFLNDELVDVEVESFFDNTFGLISSFPVIFVFWVLYTKILDYMKEPDEIVVLISLAFFLLVLLVPVFSLAEFQYENLQSVISLAVLQIINGLLLILLWIYLTRHRSRLMAQEELNITTKSYMFSRLVLIPSLYVITIAIAFFFGIKTAAIFPVIVIPTMILLGRIFSQKS